MKGERPYRLIISGGGTGGHIFPAIAIASVFKERYPDSEILFVGANGKMEMTRVPEAGYKIIGLTISGIQRKLTLSNLLFPFRLLFGYLKARHIIRQFQPDVVVGTGGYASGPIMMAAQALRVPTLIQEQNSYAGLANRKLAARAGKICVAYEEMEKYFKGKPVVVTGNPVRRDLLNLKDSKAAAMEHFIFNGKEPTLLIVGGSLGARTINESILQGLDKLIDAHVQVLWQTGKIYYDKIMSAIAGKDLRSIRVYDFIHRMDWAYAAGDVVISRAGALAISELCIAGKPAIFVPSPNVAEDHQSKNANTLVKAEAAIMIEDKKAMKQLVDEALKLLYDKDRAAKLSTNIKKLRKPDAAKAIVDEIEKLMV